MLQLMSEDEDHDRHTKEDSMRTRIGICLIAAIFVFQAALIAQEPGPLPAPSQVQAPSSPAMKADLYLANIVVHRRDGSVLYGLLAGVEPEALVIRKGSDTIKVVEKDITKVVLHVEGHQGQYMLLGAVAGIYLGNFGSGWAKNQPTAFAKSQDLSAWNYVLDNAMYAAGGIGLGYLASLLAGSEKAFSFDGDQVRRQSEWQKLRDFISGSARLKRAHLYLQTALVFPSAAGRYDDLLQKAGYSVSSGNYFSLVEQNSYAEGAGRLNLLRGIRLTFSLKPRLEVGAAVLFLGEPTISGYQYTVEAREVVARYDSTGYFLVVSFDPLAGSPTSGFRWKIGLGVGGARTRFNLSLVHEDYTYYSADAQSYAVAKNVFCPLLFSEVQLPLTGSLSIGIYADYVPATSVNIPAFPSWDLPGGKIRLGNGSAGASLGFHF
jgi:hypothetical protein